MSIFGYHGWAAVGIVLGGIALLVAAWVAALPWIVQPFVRLVLTTRYNLRRIDLDNLPKAGPVLLVSNHISWFDGFFLAAALPRRGTALVNAGMFRLPVIGFLARRSGLIPIPYSGPRAQRAAIETARQALDAGKVLGIFPEGQLTRTGLTAPFHRGVELVLSGREHVPVVPVFLDNVWGSVYSFSGQKFFRKWPKGWRRTIVIAFGPPIRSPLTIFDVRQAVLAAGVKAFESRPSGVEPLDTIDPTLPHFDHPAYGRLTGSTADVTLDGSTQIGHKEGTVGLPLPGVAIRAVNDDGEPLAAEAEGRLQALLPGRGAWVDLDRRGRVGKDGFLTLAGSPSAPNEANPGLPRVTPAPTL